MAEETKKYLYQLLLRIDGLYGILITDRDGVPVLKVINNDFIPEASTKPAFLSTFGMVTEQASKMGLGRNKTIVSMYSGYQVIQFNKLPLVVTLVANSSCNTGSLLNLEGDMRSLIQELTSTVSEA